MEIVVKVVVTGTQLGETNGNRLAWRDHLFAIQLEALELDGFIARVDDLDAELLPGWHGQAAGGELMVLKANLDGLDRECADRGAIEQHRKRDSSGKDEEL